MAAITQTFFTGLSRRFLKLSSVILWGTGFILYSTATWSIVNVENMRLVAPPEGFSGQLDMDLSNQRGNTERSRAGIGTRLQWHRRKTTDFMVLNSDSGETSGQRDINKAFLHGRHVVQSETDWAWESYAQIEHNEFTRLAYRALVGVGARHTLMQAGSITAVYLGIGGFYSSELLGAQAGATDAGLEDLWRGNFYIVFKHAFNDQVRVMSTIYYQPAMEGAVDFRLLEQAALTVKISRQLDLKLSLDVAYDSRPPQFVQGTDVSYRTGIQYRF